MQESPSVTSSTLIGLQRDARAEITAKLLGPDSSMPGTIMVTLASSDSRQITHAYLSWEQARELRHRLSVAIEAAIRSDVSVEEAVQRG